MQVDVYEVTLRKKQVHVPDTCPKCGNAFNEPGESSLLSTLLSGAGYWSHIDTSRHRPVFVEGERHDPEGIDGPYRVGLSCGECGTRIAVPAIFEEAPR